MEVEIVRTNKNLPLPQYARLLDAGMDVYADIEEKIILKPGKRVTVSTGFKVGVPEGYEIQVRPKSGKAKNNGITVLNTPGCVDAKNNIKCQRKLESVNIVERNLRK